jgi:hypothetical protein
VKMMNKTIYTLNVLNEFGHPIYQQTSDHEMAVMIYTTWSRYVIKNGWSCLTCTPSLDEAVEV